MIKTLDLIKLEWGSLPTLQLFEPVQAGFPSPAEDYRAKSLDLNKELMKNPFATYAFRVIGDSMIDVGIHSGDIVIVNKAEDNKEGKLVVAGINGGWVIKRYSSKGPKVLLLSENPNHKPIEIKEFDELIIFGVVFHVIHAVS